MIQTDRDLPNRLDAALSKSITCDAHAAMGMREERKAALLTLSPIRLANLIIEYQITLTEDSDAVEAVLDHEFGAENSSAK